MSNQPAAVSVDLAELSYMNSAGIRILFALASRLQALRIVLELIVAPRLTYPKTRACPVDHGTGSRSQILIEAISMVPRNM